MPILPQVNCPGFQISSTCGKGLGGEACGQFYNEPREAAFITFDRYLSTIITNNSEADAQPQPRPSAVSPCSEERVKNLFQIIAADADAIVVELDTNHMLSRALHVPSIYAKQFYIRRL